MGGNSTMRGIMMLDILLRQTLIGNKDMTRRDGGLKEVNETPDKWFLERWVDDVWPLFISKYSRGDQVMCKPRFEIGEIVYVKEPWLKMQTHISKPAMGGTQLHFGIVLRYNFESERGITKDLRVVNIGDRKWKNKMFMPASVARTFIKITNIKCERLLDISDKDCMAEGILINNKYFEAKPGDIALQKTLLPEENPSGARASFISLFRFANKIKPSAEIGNPWVWAYTFELVNNYTHEQK